MRIAITTTTFAEFKKAPVEMLAAKGYEIKLNPFGKKLSEEDVLTLCRDCSGIIVGTEKYSRNVLESLKGFNWRTHNYISKSYFARQICFRITNWR